MVHPATRPIRYRRNNHPPTRRLVTILFIALLCAGMVLLLFSATPVNDTDLTWAWYAGIGCVTAAALLAAINGWAT